jgi:hypothetical protein
MIDNFFEDSYHSYHSYDRVYEHPESGSSIFLGDMQAAMDYDFLRNQHIRMGTSGLTQSSRLPGTWTTSSSTRTSATSSSPSSTPSRKTSPPPSTPSTISSNTISAPATSSSTAQPASPAYSLPHPELHPRHLLYHAQGQQKLQRSHRLRSAGKAQCPPQSRLLTAAQTV